jgi:glyoxylase I family protein
MTIALRSAGIHHLTLRSTDLARSKAFYGGTLGLPIVMETQELFVALAGATAIAVRGPDTLTPEGDRFNPFRVGLDHVALGCSHEDELERVAAGLECAASAIHRTHDRPAASAPICRLQGPGRHRVGFYMAPNVSIAVVERYLEALQTGDLDGVPLRTTSVSRARWRPG